MLSLMMNVLSLALIFWNLCPSCVELVMAIGGRVRLFLPD